LFSKVMPQTLVLLLVPCLRPSVQRVAKTPGRKRAGRHDDRGGHSRRRPVATPETVRIALRTAAGRTGAGGTFIPHPTAPTTASSAAGNTDAGGNPPLPMPAAHVRRRSGQRWRRGNHMKTSTLSAAPPEDPLLTTLSKETKTLRSRAKKKTFYTPT